MQNKYKLGCGKYVGGTANPVFGIQGRLAIGFVKHGEAKNIFQARTLLQRQRKVQPLWGIEASSDGLHSNEQGLGLVTSGAGKVRDLQIRLKSWKPVQI